MNSMLWMLALLILASEAYSHDGSLGGKSNFVFIMTDDQDLQLHSIEYQAAVKKHLVSKGTSFQKHFCTVSLCCPSRVSLLTGKAAHNTNVTNVRPPYGGYPRFIAQGLNDAYLPIWLQDAGYNTYYTGKLMNGHGTDTYDVFPAKGWNRSDFLLDPGTYRYFNGIMSLDHEKHRSIRGLYSTDVIADRSLEFLGNAIAANKPFFLGIAPIGPHANVEGRVFAAPIPADRHKYLFPGIRVPRTPNFNPDESGHVSYLKHLPTLTSHQIGYADYFHRARVLALQSVDELVDRVMTALERHPEVLANTYIIYTSDNGYHIGQHRLPPGKTCNIEEDVNVPFIVRGPGVGAGQQAFFPTSHTDIVPTLFELAGMSLHDDFDGVPIPVTESAQEARKALAYYTQEHVNIEFWGSGIPEGEYFDNLGDHFAPNTYKTLRIVSETYDLMYAVWCTNEHQLYDLKTDPYQLTNLHGTQGKTSGYDIRALSQRLDTLLLSLKNCKGQECRQPWQRLFPEGGVHSLRDAMRIRYNDFFSSQPNVTFSRCAPGYRTEFEGALGPLIYKPGENFESSEEEDDWISFAL